MAFLVVNTLKILVGYFYGQTTRQNLLQLRHNPLTKNLQTLVNIILYFITFINLMSIKVKLY